MADFKVSFEFKNEEEIQKILGDISETLTSTIKDALSDLRDDIEDKTTDIVPVDTGALRDSLDISLDGDYTITCLAGMDYASYVDEGTRKMDAQPYFTEPITDLFDEFVDDLTDKLETSLQDI